MLTFKREMLVGIREIDDEHRELVSRLNFFVQATDLATEKTQVKRLFSNLKNYVIQHFANEEHLMKLYRYPGMVLHIEEHQAFVRDLKKFENNIESVHCDKCMVEDLRKIFTDWATVHIEKTDKALGDFLRSLLTN